jgi:hypothetical protein
MAFSKRDSVGCEAKSFPAGQEVADQPDQAAQNADRTHRGGDVSRVPVTTGDGHW